MGDEGERIKDFSEHQLGLSVKGDKCLLKLARISTADLCLTAMIVAVLWTDIIRLLIFTYHIWTPAIILSVAVDVLSKKHLERITSNIFITILIAIVTTFAWRATEYAVVFDPAVFGVLTCVLYLRDCC